MGINISLGISVDSAVHGQGGSPVPLITPVARYSAKGRTNQDSNRTILPDLTGNGHDITLNNFGYDGMSGFGGYVHNFNIWTINNNYKGSYTDSKWIGNGKCGDGEGFLLDCARKGLANPPAFKIKVSGLLPKTSLTYRNYINNSIRGVTIYADGEYIIPGATGNTSTPAFGFLGYGFNENGNPIVTIEQIPLYPDGLVFDGVDDYGMTSNFSTGDDYTVIAKREWFDKPSTAAFLAKRYYDGGVHWGEFTVEKGYYTNATSQSYGGAGRQLASVFNTNKSIIVQSKYKYQNLPITPGTGAPSNILLLGAGIQGQELWYGVFYDLIIYDKTLTEEEIQQEIKKYNL